MKRFLLVTISLCIFSNIAFAQNSQLPENCRTILDKNFRGWKLAKVSGDIQKFLRENNSKNNSGNFLVGDWNGDGKSDYAVLINHGYEVLNDGTKLPGKVSVAFVSRGKNFKHFVLDTFGDYISLDKKGSTAYDHETKSPIKFGNDAVFVGIWEKAGTSYVWRKNKFINFLTSD